MSDSYLTNIMGKIKTAEIFKKMGKGIGNTTDPDHHRLPPGQRMLHDPDEFPVLDLGIQPDFDPSTYKFVVTGLVENPIEWTYDELLKNLPKIALTADFHCVTKWSQFDISWAGAKYLDLEKIVKPKPDAKFVIQHGLDDYTTNVPIEDLRKDNVLIAYELKGKPIPRMHGWPVRMIIPDLYGWKGSKFLFKLEFTDHDEPGFWETRGYHNHGDPWKEERYG